LNECLFLGLADALKAIAVLVADYNGSRQHSALNYQTPAAFGAELSATSLRAAPPDGSAISPVAQPAPNGVSNAEALAIAG
jgi:putative transposase